MSPASLVVDTDVVSFLFRRDSRAELYRPHLNGRLLVISFKTVAELDRWALERDWGESRRRRMEEHLENFVVYPYDRQMCRKWAEVSDEARRRGQPVGVADAWIAATAMLHEMPLVTHNREQFGSSKTFRLKSSVTFMQANLLYHPQYRGILGGAVSRLAKL